MHDIKRLITNLSHHPGIYQMLDEHGRVLYVGKAKNLKKRVSSYFNGQAKDLKTQTLVKKIRDVQVTLTQSEMEAVLLECNLIKQHRPRYNVLLRDDKSYPYILITDHDFPRIDLYRGSRRKNGAYFGPYPSAYAVRETINLLQKLFRLRTCRDRYFEARTRPCLLNQINRCTAPCVNLVAREDYARQVELAVLFLKGRSDEVILALQNRMEAAAIALDFELAAQLRDQVMRLRQIQERQLVAVAEGDADVLGFEAQSGLFCVQLLTIRGGQVLDTRAYFPVVPAYSSTEEIMSAFIAQHYLSDVSHIESIPKQIILDVEIPEKNLLAEVLSKQVKHTVKVIQPQLGEKKKWLEMAKTSARQSLSTHLFNQANNQARIKALEELLALAKPLNRIECFDISHSSGEATVASCVVFNAEGPLKRDYRRFNIKDISAGSDVAAMRQVLLRRYKRIQKDQVDLPDVVMVDGGTIQLNVALEVMTELNLPEIFLMGVSKGPDRKAGFETLHFINRPPIHLPQDASALHFIQQIRDEAHRFAITGHRQQRDKIRRQSSLELIPGIGAKRRRELLRYFGGIQGLLRASLVELTKVPGISRSLAERIFAALHDTI